MGRGQEAAHKRVEEHKRRETPQIKYDFMFMKANGTVVENGEIVDHDDRHSTRLIAIDKDNHNVLFECLESKGLNAEGGGLEYGAKMLIDWLRAFGYKEVHLYSEGEPSNKAFTQLLVKKREEKTTYAFTPTRSHESSGSLNAMAKLAGGQFR